MFARQEVEFNVDLLNSRYMDIRKVYEALRVSQLDANELDNELLNLLYVEFGQIFRYLKPRWVQTLDEELQALIGTFLWTYSVWRQDATVGQQLLGLCYHSTVAETGESCGDERLQVVSRRQRLLVWLSTVVLPWLSHRSATLSSLSPRYSSQIMACVRYSERVWKAVELINSLVFLVQGRYRAPWQRLVRVRTVYPQPQFARQIGAEFVERELLWHGFAEMLYFLLPLINFHRITNYAKRLVSRQQPRSDETIVRQASDYTQCVVCQQWPVLPHAIGCCHVFCYYCLLSNYSTDPGFVCPACSQPITAVDCMKPVVVPATAV